MRKITKRMAREIYTRGFCLTKKYEYYENMENGGIYRVPVEMLGTTALLDEDITNLFAVMQNCVI
jgi:hypothetical protein